MLLVDVNVLVYAFREGGPQHAEYRDFVEGVMAGHAAYGVSDFVLSSFVRVTTNPALFSPSVTLDEAFAFAESFRGQPNAVAVDPGPRHWQIFVDLCRAARAKGNLVTDAYLAALAIESGSEWITTDRDFARFPGLKWRHPLEGSGR